MAKSTIKSTKTKKEKPDNLVIEWNISDDIITRFATNMVVQIIENEFKVSFFELKPDIVLSDEDRDKMLKKGAVRADCIASIIITPDRMHKYIEAMTQQLTKYESRRTDIKPDKD